MTESARPTPKLLIVDDEPDLREAMAFDFRRKGYEVLCASDGSEAFRLIQAQRFDLVITDVRMPNGDGVELLHRIKAYNTDIPVVIFITGFADMALEDAYASGAAAVFAKPFERKALHHAVARALQPREVALRPDPAGPPTVRDIELTFGDFGGAGSQGMLSFAKGGFFLAMNGPLPQVGEAVGFSFHFRRDPAIAIENVEGKGVVRWVRSEGADGLPLGCGIELLELSDACRPALVKVLEMPGQIPFIPKK